MVYPEGACKCEIVWKNEKCFGSAVNKGKGFYKTILGKQRA